MTDYHFRSKPGEAGEYIELQMTSGSGIAGVSPRGEKIMIFARTDTDEMYQKDSAGVYERMAGLPPGYIHGGIPIYVSGTVYIASGCPCQGKSRMRDEDDTFDITWNNGIYFLASATGASGVASGVTLTSGTVYHFHAIADSTNAITSVAGLIDDSMTNPNYPPGYDKSRYLFSIPTASNSTAFLKVQSVGLGDRLTIMYDETDALLTALVGGNATTFTDVDMTHLIPTRPFTQVFLHNHFDPGANGRSFELRADGSSVTWGNNPNHWQGPSTTQIAVDVEVMAVWGIIEYRVEVNTDTLEILVKGYCGCR